MDKLKKIVEQISELSEEEFDKLLKWMATEFNMRTKKRVLEMRRLFNDKY